jgi:hypothetical protein
MTDAEQVKNLRAKLIQATLRDAAVAEGVPASVIEDVQAYDRHFECDDSGEIRHKDGGSVRDWLKGQRTARPHWFSGSQDGNNADSPNNPWTVEHWSKTEQARLIEADEKKAEQMARQAGVDVWAMRPKTK